LQVTNKNGISLSNWQKSCAQQRETVRPLESPMYCIWNAFRMELFEDMSLHKRTKFRFAIQTKQEWNVATVQICVWNAFRPCVQKLFQNVIG